MKYTYILENLNCAHCAGKIEQAIAATDGYENVSFNFATKQLRFASKKGDTLEEIQAICDSIEDGGKCLFPLLFPLCLHRFNELLHAVCAVLFHFFCNMTIDVQGERCCGVPKVFLDCSIISTRLSFLFVKDRKCFR